MDNDIGIYYPELNQNGEFYIDTFTIKKFGQEIKFPNGLYYTSLIDLLVYECKMPVSNIKFKVIARHGLKCDTFKDFLIHIFKTFPEAQAKKMANSFIGDLGRKYNRTNYGFTCQDLETAQNIWTQGLTNGKNITIDNYENIYLVREQKINRILSDHTSINRFIISQSILQCFQLLNKNWTEQSELYSINTDGFFMTNPKYKYKHKSEVKFQVKNIGKAYLTDSQPNYFDKHFRENLDYKCFTDTISKTGKIYYGQAGCGKLWQLGQLIYENRNKCIVFIHTNKAIVNIKNILKNSHHMSAEQVNKICHTFESYFYDSTRGIDHLKDKIVFVDEYSMTPNHYITLLYQAFTKHGITIIMSGDTNQCEPINRVKSIRHNYFTSKSVSEMCPEHIEMKYIEGSARYDNETRVMLNNFLKYKNLKHKFQPIGNYMKNICWLNSTRQRVTKKCCDEFIGNWPAYEINFKYKSQIEKYKVCLKMPLIATQNLKKHEIFNMMEFTLDLISEDDNGNLNFKVNGFWFDKNTFRESFLPNFCNTVYKYQGGKINENYNIFDTDRMDVKELYTALSRTTKIEYIHINPQKINRYYRERPQDQMIILNSYFNADYQNGKIYHVTFEKNNKHYVGSTTRILEDRLDEPKLNPKSAIYKYRDDNPIIELICECPCKDKKTLERVENSYINEYKQKYGDQLLNIKGIKKVKTTKNDFKVEMENQKQLEERLEKLGVKFQIKDNTIKDYLVIDTKIDGKKNIS